MHMILCNAGGEFGFKYNKIHYEGGETGLLVVDEGIGYLDLLSRVKRIFSIESDGFEVKYRYPGCEIDDPLVLVSVRNDDDIHNMVSLHNSTSRSPIASIASPPTTPVQLFLFQTSDHQQNRPVLGNGSTHELPLIRKEESEITAASHSVEETVKEKCDEFKEKKRPKLSDTEWITGIAKGRMERNLPCEEKDIMDEIRDEYGYDVDYNRAWTCRNKALKELGRLGDEKKEEAKKKDDKKDDSPPSYIGMYGSNMRNGPFPPVPAPAPPPFPDLISSELRRDVLGIRAFLVEFRLIVLILQVILLLLLLHYETSKK
ncbi:hypothetical protein H6P81_005468 [Aristolochia fimbriata]|uniref:PB1 domain-containing protein n=1 Tax=Aristolochia fimbriata TaxID=158543 RepID=A0AAV7EV96_ARIFI|nr:hypothetical protein H6P81_005468 [Aristolochia fimbriata]